MEPGETPEAALRRELEEELGIVAEIGEEIWSVEHQYPGYDAVLLHFFVARRYQGTVENRIFQRISWVCPRELLQYDFLEADRALIERIAAGEVLAPHC